MRGAARQERTGRDIPHSGQRDHPRSSLPLKKKVVYTYRILQTHTGNFTLQASTGVEEKFFKTLKELIRHYKKKNQGLATHLCRSLKRKTLPDQPLQRAEPVVPNEDNDYENVDCSGDYVVVLPD
ncbi:SH2 domain-containing protein 1B isoform X2 [Cyprinus carpio]|uniref:SH2 domain-containing protein 1B isoform X2 n=1 Tax=Cyprinus carpio TaxID=7962 RepID=A0A9Q9VAL6_CYPCA|nr:SH2 domain-containing protein 1B isoform X2 [Cyprinus carpio]